jgi:hypothetical protein
VGAAHLQFKCLPFPPIIIRISYTCQIQHLTVENTPHQFPENHNVFQQNPLPKLMPSTASPPPPSSSATTSTAPPGVSPRPPPPPPPESLNPVQSNKHRSIFKQNPFQVQAKKNQMKQKKGKIGFSFFDKLGKIGFSFQINIPEYFFESSRNPPESVSQLYNLTKNANPWLRPRKNEPKKQRISFFFLRNLPQGF